MRLYRGGAANIGGADSGIALLVPVDDTVAAERASLLSALVVKTRHCRDPLGINTPRLKHIAGKCPPKHRKSRKSKYRQSVCRGSVPWAHANTNVSGTMTVVPVAGSTSDETPTKRHHLHLHTYSTSDCSRVIDYSDRIMTNTIHEGS